VPAAGRFLNRWIVRPGTNGRAAFPGNLRTWDGSGEIALSWFHIWRTVPGQAGNTGAASTNLVLNVRDIENSHRFLDRDRGLPPGRQLTLDQRAAQPATIGSTQASRGRPRASSRRCLGREPRCPAARTHWSMFGMPCAVNHIAITCRPAGLAGAFGLLQKKGGVRPPVSSRHDAQPSYIHESQRLTGIEFV